MNYLRNFSNNPILWLQTSTLNNTSKRIVSTIDAKGVWKENMSFYLYSFLYQKLEIKLYKYSIHGLKLALSKTMITHHVWYSRNLEGKIWSSQCRGTDRDTLLTCWLFFSILWHIWQFLCAQFSGIMDVI